MRVTFWRSDSLFDRRVATAFGAGVRAYGHEFEEIPSRFYEGPHDETDVAVAVGVRQTTKRILQDHTALGKDYVYIDKGYTRHRGEDPHVKTRYLRASVNATQPLAYFQRQLRPSDRFDALDVHLAPRYYGGYCVLYAGSSQKYCEFHGLGDATRYAEKILHRVRKTSRAYQRLTYRPKPSWRDAVPIEGAKFSRPPRTINDELHEARLLVTHGSNAALDAIFAGVPALVLGPSIAQPIAATCFEELPRNPEMLPWPDIETRLQWAYNLAYCQWTLREFETGEAWSMLLQELAK